MARAVLYREKADWTTEVVSIDLAGLMAGRVKDIELRTNDMLIIASVSEMRETYTVTVFGSVSKPDTYPYAENMTVEDLLVAAGGLLESASTANVTITRRIKDSKSVKVQEQLFKTFTVEVKDGLVVDGEQGFVLEPFDEVFVRRSPVYITQSSVTVKGEVAFEGNYPLARRNMRLSEVVAAAGNATPGAFIEGAYLMRKMTDEEQVQQKASLTSLLLIMQCTYDRNKDSEYDTDAKCTQCDQKRNLDAVQVALPSVSFDKTLVKLGSQIFKKCSHNVLQFPERPLKMIQ
jgi:protein involved in polysaccharide export with SLBB domain